MAKARLTLTVQLDPRLTEAFEALRAEYASKNGYPPKNAELARILIRSALDNEPQQIVAEEALIRMSAVTSALAGRVREFLKDNLSEILSEVEEKVEG
jgi:hypothetical protein